jgi:hypothetical protein
MENPFFFLATHKTIVAKVVGDGVIQNLAKYGASFKSFPFQKAKPYLIPLEIQAN